LDSSPRRFVLDPQISFGNFTNSGIENWILVLPWSLDLGASDFLRFPPPNPLRSLYFLCSNAIFQAFFHFSGT
jgi:hypothetical protein